MANQTPMSRVAFTSGASAGIGKAVAIALVDAGWKVTLAAMRGDLLEQLASQCGEENTLAVVTDVAAPQSAQRALSAHTPRPFSAAYTATKHGVTGLTKSIALDGRAHNICGGQIDIGNAATEMTERMSSGVLQPDGSKMPEPRMDVRHVAETIVGIANLPWDANVLSMTIMATGMPFVGRGGVR